MFYHQRLRDKREALSAAWVSGNHLPINRGQLQGLKVMGMVEALIEPESPMSLRALAICLEGVAIIHHEQMLDLLRKLHAIKFDFPEGPRATSLRGESAPRHITLPEGNELACQTALFRAEWERLCQQLPSSCDLSPIRSSPKRQRLAAPLEEMQRMRYIDEGDLSYALQEDYPAFDSPLPTMQRTEDSFNFGPIGGYQDDYLVESFDDHPHQGETAGAPPQPGHTLVDEIQQLLGEETDVANLAAAAVVPQKKPREKRGRPVPKTSMVSSKTYRAWQNDHSMTVIKRARASTVQHRAPGGPASASFPQNSALGKLWRGLLEETQQEEEQEEEGPENHPQQQYEYQHQRPHLPAAGLIGFENVDHYQLPRDLPSYGEDPQLIQGLADLGIDPEEVFETANPFPAGLALVQTSLAEIDHMRDGSGVMASFSLFDQQPAGMDASRLSLHSDRLSIGLPGFIPELLGGESYSVGEHTTNFEAWSPLPSHHTGGIMRDSGEAENLTVDSEGSMELPGGGASGGEDSVSEQFLSYIHAHAANTPRLTFDYILNPEGTRDMPTRRTHARSFFSLLQLASNGKLAVSQDRHRAFAPIIIDLQ